MRRLLLAIVVLLAPVSVLASSSGGSELLPRCGGPFQLCGYIDGESEAEIIPQNFQVAQPFREGLAAVRIDGRYGYINPRGEIVIAPRFQAASPFSGGYAEVRIDNASGAIDRTGKLVVPARFSRLIHFANGTFIAEPMPDNPSQHVRLDQKLETLPDSITLTGLRAAGLYHRDRGWLTDRELTFSIFDDPQRGLIWAGHRDERSEKQWGLLKADGSWKVTPRYTHVQRLSETHAVVNAPTQPDLPPIGRRESVRWGAVDRNGDLVVPLKFAILHYWRGGYGYAREGKPFGADGKPNEVREAIVKADGSLLGGRYFDEIEIRGSDTLPRARIDNTWYSVTRSGNLVPDQRNGERLLECESGMIILHRGEQAEFQFKGRSIGRFDNTYFGQRNCPGPFSARRGDRWFYVMENGRVLGGHDGFENTYHFSGNHSPVKVGGKWGIIDRSGAYSVRPQFAELRPGMDETYDVGEGADEYWINATGERIEPPVAERPSPEQSLTCAGGLRYFQKGKLWGFQDAAGKTVIEPKFRALSCFQQGVSWVAEPRGDGWCAIGPDGSPREALQCRETYYPVRVTHHYPERFDEDPYESSVQWNQAWLDYQAGNRDEPPKWIGDGVRSGGSYTVMSGGPGRAASLSKPVDHYRVVSDFKLAWLGIVAIIFAGFGMWFWKRRKTPEQREKPV